MLHSAQLHSRAPEAPRATDLRLPRVLPVAVEVDIGGSLAAAQVPRFKQPPPVCVLNRQHLRWVVVVVTCVVVVVDCYAMGAVSRYACALCRAGRAGAFMATYARCMDFVVRGCEVLVHGSACTMHACVQVRQRDASTLHPACILQKHAHKVHTHTSPLWLTEPNNPELHAMPTLPRCNLAASNAAHLQHQPCENVLRPVSHCLLGACFPSISRCLAAARLVMLCAAWLRGVRCLGGC